MFKNVASQKIALFAYDATTGTPKTGDSANITPYLSKDYGSVTALGDSSATEMDATNAKGWYLFDVTQTETNADALLFTAKSSTSNIYIVGQLIYTDPPNFTAASIDSNGRVDVIKIAGTTQTARDIGTSVLLSSGTGTGQLSFTSGILKIDVDTIKTNPVVNGGTITFPTTATLASTTNITAGTVAVATAVTTVNGLAAGVITATSIAADAITAAKVADGTIDAATFAAGAINAAAIAADAITDAKVASDVTIASVTGNVGGNVTGSVGSIASGGIAASSFAAGAIDAAAIATDAIDADAIKTDAVTEIQSGLSTLTAAGIRTAVGLASANLDTQLTAIDDYVDTEVAAIKAKTDQLVFTVANQVDVNVLDWKSATAPAMTGDAYARLGAPAGASVSADVAAVQVDTTAVKVQTDKLTFTVANKIDANVLNLNGDATSAANIAKTTRAIGRGTVSGVPTTTSIPTSAFAPATSVADQLKGRIVTFDADTTTAALRGQATDITASTSSATPTLTVTALTTAPVSGDSFSVT